MLYTIKIKLVLTVGIVIICLCKYFIVKLQIDYWILLYFLMVDFSGDRTKHLRNIHGIQNVPSASAGSSSSGSSSLNISNGISGLSSVLAEETNSSISSFHSASDTSLASSMLESPIKQEPLDQHLLGFGDVDPDMVTMSIDEVMQFAQPVVSDFC